MRKKFSVYTINCDKARIKDLGTDNIGYKLYEVRTELWGTIEIGIEIDKWTWRSDWFLRHAFGENYSQYSIKELEQRSFTENYVEHNQITALVIAK